MYFRPVSKKGTLTLPIAFRKQLDLKPGDKVAINLIENNDLTNPRGSTVRVSKC